MDGMLFHHPDWSFPVVRRKVTLELLDALDQLGRWVATQGRSQRWLSAYPNQQSYRMAIYRLAKAGLVAYRRDGGRDPVLILTAEGQKRVSPDLYPEHRWKRKWNRLWYLLIYDVPEKQRVYRRSLRGFFKRLRAGCLQKSVMVSAFDIRPEFEDLKDAVALGDYAFLFEAHTVLGLPADVVVRTAWDFDRINAAHAGFIKSARRWAHTLSTTSLPPAQLHALGHEAMCTYLSVMEDDPLLPSVLWPAGYRGPEVVESYRLLQQIIAARI